MRIKPFFVLTLVVFVLIALDVILWLNHQLAHGYITCNCPIPLDGWDITILSLGFSSFLFLIGFLAYVRDRRPQILLICAAYLILSAYSILWLWGIPFPEESIEHTIAHEYNLLLLIPVVLLMGYVFYGRGK